MRKIETKEDIEKKETRNKIIIGVVLAGIMLLSTLGYAFFSGDKNNGDIEKVSINGREFYKYGSLWAVDVNNQAYYFTYLPNETYTSLIKKNVQNYQGKPLYFTKLGQAENEIAKNLENIAERISFACYDENCTEDWPVKNCSSNILIISEQDIGNNPFREEENCVFIFSNETVKAADAFVYRILGIN